MLVCRRCNRLCDLRFEYDLELETGAYPLEWYRCPSCGGEYLQSPDLLLPELESRERGASLGSYRKVALCHATASDNPEEPGGRSVSPLVATALAEDLVDVALMPDYGQGRRLRAITDPEEATGLHRSWSTPARSIPVNASVAANLDFLMQVEQFAREDGGVHRRIAVVGRPCQVYIGRRANLEKIAPGYEVPLAIGLFCYGNVSQYASPAQRFERLTGIPPAEIRGMTASEGKVRVAGGDRGSVEVPIREFASFLHKSCMNCVDFTSPWADVSLGEDPRIPGFDVILVRTAAGENLFERAHQTGRLQTWSPPWMEGGGDSLRILSDLTAVKRELASAP